MEDIIAVLDGRPEIISEVKQVDEVLHKHLSERFTRLLHDVNFVDSLPGHLPGDAASQARLPLVMERIAAIAKDE
jgi:hypothetical protein